MGFLFTGAGLSTGAATAAPGSPGIAPGYTIIMNYEFQGANPNSYSLTNSASLGSYCDGAADAECLAYARIQAPEGALLEGLDVWGHDHSPDSDLHYSVIANCDPPGGGATDLILDSGNLVTQDGDFHFGFTYTPGFPVNNSECGYSIRVKFTDNGEPPRGAAIRIRKARFTWTRQVSPAPPSARFTDVPTRPSLLPVHRGARPVGDHGGMRARHLLSGCAGDARPDGGVSLQGAGTPVAAAAVRMSGRHAKP